MELAKITSKEQITIPISIRKRLGVKDGDKVLFIPDRNKIGEDDVVALVKKIRAERSGG